jgi:hypothetical protein
MNSSIRSIASIVLLSFLSNGCSDDPPSPQTQTNPNDATAVQLFDPCLNGEPDDIADIPRNGHAFISSTDGGYAHDGNGCTYWIADFRQYRYSNSTIIGGIEVARAILTSANAYDLPSSIGFGEILPTNQYDCENLVIRRKHYLRSSVESSFPVADKEQIIHGTWNPNLNSCSAFDTVNTVKTYPPIANVLVHRWLVNVQLRGTTQQAGARVVPAGPD